MRPTYLPLIKKIGHTTSTISKTTIPIWDLCSSYYNICTSFLDRINCPNNLRLIQACSGNSSNYPHGVLEEIVGQCECGGLNLLNDRQFEVVIDAVIFERLNNKYLYIPPPNAAYSLVMSSSPFKQLTHPGRTIPSQ